MRRFERLLKELRQICDRRAARAQKLIETPKDFDAIDEAVVLYHLLKDLSKVPADSTTGQPILDPIILDGYYNQVRWAFGKMIQAHYTDLLETSVAKLKADPTSRFNDPKVFGPLEQSIKDAALYAILYNCFDGVLDALNGHEAKRALVLRGALREEVLAHQKQQAPNHRP